MEYKQIVELERVFRCTCCLYQPL